MFFRADLMAEVTGYSVVVMPGMNVGFGRRLLRKPSLPLAVYGADDITWDMTDTDVIGLPGCIYKSCSD